MTEQMPVRRANRGMASMLWSLLPLTALVVLAVVFFRPRSHPTPTIDPAPDFAFAGRTMHLRLPTPHGLPAGWRATSSGVTAKQGATSMRVGYLTGDKEYAELTESNRPVAALVTTTLAGEKRTGASTVAGQSWARYRTGRGETALAGRVGSVSVLVTGSASDAELRTLAASLR